MTISPPLEEQHEEVGSCPVCLQFDYFAVLVKLYSCTNILLLPHGLLWVGRSVHPSGNMAAFFLPSFSFSLQYLWYLCPAQASPQPCYVRVLVQVVTAPLGRMRRPAGTALFKPVFGVGVSACKHI